MSLLTDASLIVTPNAYNVGKLYSVVPNTTLGDMDVSRATSATRVNEQGFIEIARTNLVLQSQTFNNVYWTPTAVTVTADTTAAPDGTTTADTVTGIGAISARLIQSNSISFTTATSYSLSVFAKKGTNDFIQLFVPLAIGGMFANFNINTGVVGTLGTVTGTTPTSSIIDYGNGWYRCTINFTATTTTSTVTSIGIVTSASAIRSESNTLTTSVILWGAQLEPSNVATEYIPTTTSIRTKFAGITQDGSVAQNIPRIDYPPLGGCPSILVEPIRTNLVLYSEEFNNAIWDKGPTITLVSNTTEIASPQGINNATKATANGTGFIFIRQNVFPTTLLPTTNSIFVKKANNRYVGFRNGGSGTLHDVFDFNTETWTNNSGSTLSFDKLINGWYRLKSSRTNTLVNNYTSITIPSNTSGNETDTVSNLTLYLWGGQSELNVLNSTSYIPTTTATVPRAADVISKTGISSLIGQTQGTLYFEVQGFSDGNPANQFITLSDGTTNNQIGFTYTLTTGSINGYFRISPNTIQITSTVLKTLNSKIILKYNSSNVYTLFINGSLIGTGTAASGFSSPLTAFKTSQGDGGFPYNGNIKMISIWKTALSDDQCILLTGPSFSSYPEMANALIYTLQ
jgi:hypothetical protein